MEATVFAIYVAGTPNPSSAEKREIKRDAKKCSKEILALPASKRASAVRLLRKVMHSGSVSDFRNAVKKFHAFLKLNARRN